MCGWGFEWTGFVGLWVRVMARGKLGIVALGVVCGLFEGRLVEGVDGTVLFRGCFIGGYCKQS